MKTALGLVLAAVLVAAGCGKAEVTAQPAAAHLTVPEQLRFTATTVDGQPFAGESLAGKAAVLWFWTPWCDTCQEEAPGIAKAAQAHQGKVTFIGVAAEDKAPAMKDFVTRYGTGSFTNLADPDGKIWARFGVRIQPGYAFISPQGTVEMVKIPMDDGELAAKVDQLAR
ncbi:MAG TPA: redoxin domain-containing protein [Amycolatopsis sp.]|nr:redoxin domain-containing protein [Amycolatopsis sp.]